MGVASIDDRSLLRAIRQPQVREVIATAAVNVSVVGIGSIGGLILAKFLGPTERGDLVTIIQWPITIGALSGLGIVQATCYWVARAHERAAAVTSTAVLAVFVTGIAIALTSPFVATRIGRNDDVRVLLMLALAATPMYLSSRVWISALQATNIRQWNAARCVQPSLYFLGVLVAAAAHRLSIYTATAAFVLSLTAELLAAVALKRRAIGRDRVPEFRWLKPLYAFGSKVWLASVPQTVNVSVDQLVLSVVPTVAAAQLGNYAVAASLSWLALPAAMAFGYVAFPRIARARNEDAIRRVENASLAGAATAATAIILVVLFLAPFFVSEVLGSGYRDSVPALWLLAPGAVLLALNRVAGDILQGRGHPLTQSVAEGVGAVATLVLLLTLIPPLGIRGAAIASSTSYGVVFVVLMAGLRRIRTQRSRERARTIELASASRGID